MRPAICPFGKLYAALFLRPPLSEAGLVRMSRREGQSDRESLSPPSGQGLPVSYFTPETASRGVGSVTAGEVNQGIANDVRDATRIC